MSKEQKVNQLHDQAMNFVEEAYLAKRAKDMTQAKKFWQKAFELEKEAAMQLANDYDIEPTRSVLFKGAASLALNVENYREVERMVGLGLAGNPPVPIYQELHELLDTAKLAVSNTSPMEKFQQLPQNLQKEVANFIDFLMVRNGVLR